MNTYGRKNRFVEKLLQRQSGSFLLSYFGARRIGREILRVEYAFDQTYDAMRYDLAQ